MLKKIVIITILLILGGIFFCAIKVIGIQPKKTVIQFSSWGSKSELEILNTVIKDYETENPEIKIDLMHIPQNYFQKIHLLFASNTPPDVIFINNHYLPVYANAGLLEPLQTNDDFYEKSIIGLSWGNTLYAIPRDISTLVIYYNKDIFDRNKIKYPNGDWTFNEFLNTAKKLTHDGVYGISFEEDILFYLPYLMSEGGGILSDDLSRMIINDEPSKKGLEFYANLRKKYHVAPKREEIASATMAQMFLQGKLAMHLSGRWLVPKYRSEAGFDWDVVSFPKGEAGSVVPLDVSGWAVAKDSKHKAEAIKFINYLSSAKTIEKFTKSGLIVPARKDVALSSSFIDNQKPIHAKVFLDTIENSKPTPVSIDYKEIMDNLKGKFEHVFN